MHLERVRAVLERIRRATGLIRQLAHFTDRNKSRTEPVCNHRSENEAAALHADDELDRAVLEGHDQAVDRRAERGRVLEQRRDVIEEDAGFREIRNVADFLLECVHSHLMWKPFCAVIGKLSSTVTRSTREAGGPCRIARSKRSIAAGSPMAAVSTRPSSRFRTQPA